MDNFTFKIFFRGRFKEICPPSRPVYHPRAAKSEAFADHRWTKPRQQYEVPAGQDHGGAGLPPQGHPGQGQQEVQAEDRGHCGGCPRFF